MSKKQQIILLHGDKQFTDKSLIEKGELVVEHGSTAADVKLHTLDNTGEIATFVTETSVDNKISTEIAKVNKNSELEALQTKVDGIDAAYKAADETLQSNINAEKNARESADTKIREDFAAADTEIREDFAAADEALDEKITSNTNAIATLNGGVDAPGSVAKAVNDAKSSITSAYESADTKIREDFAAADTKIREDFGAADATLSGQIEAIEAAYKADDAEIRKDFAAADAALKSAYESADNTLSSRISGNTSAIETLNGDADTLGSVAAAVEVEKNRAEGIESGLDSRLGNAESAITALNTFKNTTVPATYATKDALTAATDNLTTKINEKLAISDFKIYTGATEVTINALDANKASKSELSAATKTLISEIEKAQSAASSKVVEGTDKGNNMTIVPTTGDDKSVTYTINLTDVASANALEGVSNKVTTLIGNDANKSVRTIANEELAAQLLSGDAEADFKTLQDLATWLEDHPESAAAMNTAISANTQSISDEVTARTNADTTLQNNINAEETARKNAITAVTASYQAADKAINDKIGTIADGKTVAGLISDEATARANADKAINDKIGTIADGQTVVGLIEAERSAREQAISGITSVVENLDATVGSTSVAEGKHVAVQVVQKDGKLTGLTVTESDIASAAALTSADTRLTNAISAEETARKNADNAIDAKIGGSYSSSSTVHAAITAVEGAYVKQVKVISNGVTTTYSPVNNVLDLSDLVIDGGTY